MLASPLVVGVLRYWKIGLIALLCLGLAVQTVRLGAANNRAERIQINLNEARAELKAISTKKAEQRAETERRIKQADKGRKDAETIAQRIERAPVKQGACETPAEIMQEPSL